MGKDSELLDACKNGNFATVERILLNKPKRQLTLPGLKRGSFLTRRDDAGYTSLHYAALNGHLNIVSILLSAEGENVLVRDKRGCLPLHLACWGGHRDVVKALLVHDQCKRTVNLQNSAGDTPLHLSCQYGHVAIANLLLQHNAEALISNNAGETALDLASRFGRDEVVHLLVTTRPTLILSFGSDDIGPPGQRHPSVNGSVTRRAPPPVVLRPTLLQSSPLHLAARHGKAGVVKILLKAGFDVNFVTEQGTALHEAALFGRAEIVELLLQNGADPSIRNADGLTVEQLLIAHQAKKSAEITQLMTSRQAWNDIALIIKGFDSQDDIDPEGEVIGSTNVPSKLPCRTAPDPPTSLTYQNISPVAQRTVWMQLPSNSVESARCGSTSPPQLSPSQPDDSAVEGAPCAPPIKPRRHASSPKTPTLTDTSTASSGSGLLSVSIPNTISPHGMFEGGSPGDAYDDDVESHISPMSSISLSSFRGSELGVVSDDTPRLQGSFRGSSASKCKYSAIQTGYEFLPKKPYDNVPAQKTIPAYDNVPTSALQYDNVPPGHKHWSHECRSRSEKTSKPDQGPVGSLLDACQAANPESVSRSHPPESHRSNESGIISQNVTSSFPQDGRDSAQSISDSRESSTVGSSASRSYDSSQRGKGSDLNFSPMYGLRREKAVEVHSVEMIDMRRNQAACIVSHGAKGSSLGAFQPEQKLYSSSASQNAPNNIGPPSPDSSKDENSAPQLNDPTGLRYMGRHSRTSQNDQSALDDSVGELSDISGLGLLSSMAKAKELSKRQTYVIEAPYVILQGSSIVQRPFVNPADPLATSAGRSSFDPEGRIIEEAANSALRVTPTDSSNDATETFTAVLPLGVHNNGATYNHRSEAVVTSRLTGSSAVASLATGNIVSDSEVDINPPDDPVPSELTRGSEFPYSRMSLGVRSSDIPAERRSVGSHTAAVMAPLAKPESIMSLQGGSRSEISNPPAGDINDNRSSCLESAPLLPTSSSEDLTTEENGQNQPKLPTPDFPPPSAWSSESKIHQKILPLRERAKRLSADLSGVTLRDAAVFTDIPFVDRGTAGDSCAAPQSSSTSSSCQRSSCCRSTYLSNGRPCPHCCEVADHNIEDGKRGTVRSGQNVPGASLSVALQVPSPSGQRTSETLRESEEWHEIDRLVASIDQDLPKLSRDRNASEAPGLDLDSWMNWLEKKDLSEFRNVLALHGFDSVPFMGLLDERDLREIIPQSMDSPLPSVLARLADPPEHLRLNCDDQIGSSTSNWLRSLQLDDYIGAFKRHDYDSLSSLRSLNEQLLLRIGVYPLGHRKRILWSIHGEYRPMPITGAGTITGDTDENVVSQPFDLKASYSSSIFSEAPWTPRTPPPVPIQQPPNHPSASQSPIDDGDDDDDDGASSKQHNWIQDSADLIERNVPFTAHYLGSRLIENVTGTESTREAIQHIKKHTKEVAKVPMVELRISYRGVEIVDSTTKTSICNHNVQEIHCVCQDDKDLNCFAYIAKDGDRHFCHVFGVHESDMATKVILTLGQAFEVAYQVSVQDSMKSTAV